MTHRIFPTFAGQSLTEYGLVGGLVVIAVVTAVMLLGSRGEESLSRSHEALFGQAESGGLHQTAALLSQSSVLVPGATTLTLTLQDGTVITLDNYPANLGRAIETVGADGTTDMLAANLRTLARQLRDQGKITEAEYNQLADLANQGHRLAEIQRLIEGAATRAGGDKAAFNSQQIMFEGRGPYNALELALLVGGSTRLPGNTELGAVGAEIPQAVRDTFEQYRPQAFASLNNNLQDFRIGTEFQKLIQSKLAVDQGAYMRDPALRTVVDHLFGQIFQTSHTFTQVVGLTTNIGGEFEQYSPRALNQMTASTVNDTHSRSLCAAGGGVDTGVRCPKGTG
jgi:Flp pilus assembly pilin Flp